MTNRLLMFCINLKIQSIKTTKLISLPARFYLKMDHFHYFISEFVPLQATQIPINISHRFNVPEEQPQFTVLLLTDHNEKVKKILGEATFNATEWPIDQQKVRIESFSESIWVSISIYNTYKTLLQFGAIQQRENDESQINRVEAQQEESQIQSNYSFLQQKNARLKEQLQQLLTNNRRMEQQRFAKRKMMENLETERNEKLKQKKREVDEVKRDLQLMNVKIGEIINLVNAHGELEICNTVLDLLAKPYPQQ